MKEAAWLKSVGHKGLTVQAKHGLEREKKKA